MEYRPKVVTAVGSIVRSNKGREYSERLQRAMAQAVLECNAEGLSTDEANSDVIRDRMLAARDREKDRIAAESVPGNPRRGKWWMTKSLQKWVNRPMVK